MKAKVNDIIKQLHQLQIRQSKMIETMNEISKTESHLDSNTTDMLILVNSIAAETKSSWDQYEKQLKVSDRVIPHNEEG